MVTTAQKIRDWLSAALAASQMTVSELAIKSGVNRATIFRAMKPGYEFVTSRRTVEALAEALNVPPPESEARERQLIPKFLPVRFIVKAGLWMEMEDFAQDFVEDSPLAVVPDPRFAEWPQWLERVDGDSVNKMAADGSYIHVVDALEMGYSPLDKDFVVVERRRNGEDTMWQVRERSVKQVEVDKKGRIKLWPRSTNPKWSEPIDYTTGLKEGEDAQAQVVGLVLGVYTALR